MPLILTFRDVEEVLRMEDCLSVLEESYRSLSLGTALNRPRSHLHFPKKETGRFYMFKSMEGAIRSFGVLALRISSDCIQDVVENEIAKQEKLPLAPNQQFVGLLLLFSIETLQLLCIMPEGHLQRMRVGGSYALGAKYFSGEGSKIVGLLGSGWQAATQLIGLSLVRPIERILVYSPTKEHRVRFAKEWTQKLGKDVRPADDPKEVFTGAEIIVEATNSNRPVFSPDWLEKGQHINSITARAIDPAVLEKCDVLGARDLKPGSHWYLPDHYPEQVKADKRRIDLRGKELIELGDVITGKCQGRTARNQITFFGTEIIGGPGLGTEFAAVGAKVYQLAKEKGLGRTIPDEWFLQPYHS